MERTHIFLPKPYKEALELLAERLDMKVSELIRRAIYEFLLRQK